MYKNVAGQKLAIYVWDGANGVPKTGDAANITAQISKDGSASATTNDTNPTELDATNHPGVYVFDLTQAESNGDMVIITPVSSTADIVIQPVISYTNPLTPTKAAFIDASISGISTISVNDILTGVIEGTITLKQALSILIAFVSGLSTGGGSSSIKFKNIADDTDRITMTVDSNGNRSAVIIDVSDL